MCHKNQNKELEETQNRNTAAELGDNLSLQSAPFHYIKSFHSLNCE